MDDEPDEHQEAELRADLAYSSVGMCVRIGGVGERVSVDSCVGRTCVGGRAASHWLLAGVFSEWRLCNERPWEWIYRPGL